MHLSHSQAVNAAATPVFAIVHLIEYSPHRHHCHTTCHPLQRPVSCTSCVKIATYGKFKRALAFGFTLTTCSCPLPLPSPTQPETTPILPQGTPERRICIKKVSKEGTLSTLIAFISVLPDLSHCLSHLPNRHWQPG